MTLAHPIQTVCVCGAGTMGSGIAQLTAQKGFHTILYDVSRETTDKARSGLEHSLLQLVEKKKITDEEKTAILGRLRFTNDVNDCLADIVIEAIVEKAPVKTALFNQLAEINHSEVIFATNTSSLSVTDIASQVMRPERVAGMHFFNPAPVMKLVEVVATPHSNEATLQSIMTLAEQLGKTAVLCKDAPGFIVNHVARPYYLEALKLVEMGVADFETIDNMLEATGFKMGPFRLMDLIGNDINYAVSCSVYDQLGQPARLKPSDIQRERVERQELGRKSGKGYYNYP
ncbi:3-hydroxyacyl-CoA dehydrogenase NAD-binding domain-containing protein [Paraflavitalea sp. CAU 1676]|uniref:3-hydroxyacyl-CoA dehydrogenase family protein n=1 Tax=Paraflavitalea sp. CAU 1676 TaxID=3032598 RepID=UPI0023DABB8F|nr:3-hydroxyacyl-CoA dehydrogenase NAD-binding domain-containing protein [Paraflavitalea sp. CAU 1676]MDF2190746.1 3-hydroxyacyl-CoA dehydrogenase NAD-binding domain-containing protein [Paraflavitalea sp. CAU 1676]